MNAFSEVSIINSLFRAILLIPLLSGSNETLFNSYSSPCVVTILIFFNASIEIYCDGTEG